MITKAVTKTISPAARLASLPPLNSSFDFDAPLAAAQAVPNAQRRTPHDTSNHPTKQPGFDPDAKTRHSKATQS